MDRKKVLCGMAAVVGMVFFSCTEKKPSADIITTKPVEEQAPRAVQEVGNYDQTVEAAWLGTTYTVEMHRMADVSLPTIDDGQGNRYYDNKIAIRVIRRDGSEFFSRTFTKEDFGSQLDASYKKNGALLGIVFDKSDGDALYFAASVGSPDKASDEYVPFVVRLSRYGQVSISRDTQLDTANIGSGVDEDDDGV